jgi:hypothetical protein
MIGITTPLTNRIGGEVGIQTGRLLIDNLIDFHSYMPGMGVAGSNGRRILGDPVFDIGSKYSLLVRIKYRI